LYEETKCFRIVVVIFYELILSPVASLDSALVHFITNEDI
jgi:hypothetical protein